MLHSEPPTRPPGRRTENVSPVSPRIASFRWKVTMVKGRDSPETVSSRTSRETAVARTMTRAPAARSASDMGR